MTATRSSPLHRLLLLAVVVLGLGHVDVLHAVLDVGADTARHVDAAVPTQADADDYACRVAAAAQDANGEWLVTPDDPTIVECP